MLTFGELKGGIEDAHIEKNTLGQIIEKNILALQRLNPLLQIIQYVIMPDHIHFLLFVTNPIDMPIGNYIGMMKVRIGQEFRAAGGCAGPVFEKNFDDRILHKRRSLSTIVNYIRSNPRRLAVRRAHPEYFRLRRGVEICGRRCSIYGNHFLLGNPFREQVVVHRADSEAVRNANKERWIHTAANGGVLVSPFISPAEKAIRSEAEALNAKIILITNEAMPERYKPAARDFAQCEAGRLLIISPEGLSADLTRVTCLAMNALADDICKSNL